MKCPRCGNERHEFNKKPQRFDGFDLRKTECMQCGLMFRQRSVIDAVQVFNPFIEEVEWIPINDFQQHGYLDFLRHKRSHPKTPRTLE